MGIASAYGQDDPGEDIYSRYQPRTAQIETIGKLYDNSQEIGGGSGLLIGDRYVLTNNHVLPFAVNYRTLQIRVRLASRNGPPIDSVSIQRDVDNDLALVELATPVQGAGGTRCPMPVIDAANEALPGSRLFLMGFPLDRDLSIASGLISNQSPGDRWQTDTVMNPGNSGGPAFNAHQALLGLAVGGIVNWIQGANKQPVNGVNFIIPALTILQSPLFKIIQSLPAQDSCWTAWRNTKLAESNKERLAGFNLDLEASVPKIAEEASMLNLPEIIRTPYISDAPANKLARPDILRRTFTIAETKGDRPDDTAGVGQYSRQFSADPSYRITDCHWDVMTANNSSGEACRIAESGATATFTFQLSSGAPSDQNRGWLGGTLTLTQKLSSR